MCKISSSEIYMWLYTTGAELGFLLEGVFLFCIQM